MSNAIPDPRPCERQCRTCGLWKHHSRFHQKKKRGAGSNATIWFAPDCKDCETKVRNEKKNEDRARTIIERRARDHAAKAGVSFDFMWINMNYRALVPMYRAASSPEGLCLYCGHPFDNERDIQIEHHFPPRHPQDWPRLHARNIGIACASCNRGKSSRAYDVWLDQQEEARLSNEVTRTPLPKSANQLMLDW